MTRVQLAFVDLLFGRSPFDVFEPKPSRRRSLAGLGRAFAINTIESVRTTTGISGVFNRTLTGGTNDIKGEIAVSKSKSWTVGTAVDQISQALTTTVSIAGGATNNFDLVGNMTNVVGDASAPLTGIKSILIELINVAQDATNGTACTGITIGNHATAAWVAPFGATGTYVIKSGGYWHHEEPTAGGVAVTATTADILKIVNNDGAVAAYVRITIIGIP